MSPSCASVCLLVLLGVGSARFLPLNLEQAHKSIEHVLSLTQPDLIPNPLFSSVISSINTSCQVREEVKLMNATLDVYMRIFSSILHNQHTTGSRALLDQVPESERPGVKKDLGKLQQKMETLKRQLSQQNRVERTREDVISELNNIKVDDPVVQRKALAQFKEIYQAASVVADHRHGLC